MKTWVLIFLIFIFASPSVLATALLSTDEPVQKFRGTLGKLFYTTEVNRISYKTVETECSGYFDYSESSHSAVVTEIQAFPPDIFPKCQQSILVEGNRLWKSQPTPNLPIAVSPKLGKTQLSDSVPVGFINDDVKTCYQQIFNRLKDQLSSAEVQELFSKQTNGVLEIRLSIIEGIPTQNVEQASFVGIEADSTRGSFIPGVLRVLYLADEKSSEKCLGPSIAAYQTVMRNLELQRVPEAVTDSVSKVIPPKAVLPIDPLTKNHSERLKAIRAK